MPSNPLTVYAEWVRRNPAAATSAENVSRMFALIFANPESLLSMEGNWCLAKLHRLSNHILLETDGQPTTFSGVLSWGLRVVNEAESIVELYLRQKWSHRAGWRMVLLVNVLRILCSWVIKRDKVKEALQTLREFLVSKRRNSTISAAQDASRPEPTTRLVVPKVVTQSSPLSGSSVGWMDVLAVLADAYGAVRQLLLAASTYLAFPAHRLGATAKIVPITAPPSSVRSLAVSLSPTWTVWRTFLLADLVALVASYFVQRYRRPIVVVDDSVVVDADFSQLEPQLEEEDSADERRLQEAMRPLTKHVFHDPFFSVVLKGTVYRHLVDGFINRWIPLLGPLLGNQIRYMLAMQQHCYLYTE